MSGWSNASSTCIDEEAARFSETVLSNLRLRTEDLSPDMRPRIDRAIEKKIVADRILGEAGLEIPNSVNIVPCRGMCNSIYFYGNNRLKFSIYSIDDPNWHKVFEDPDRRLSGPTFIHEYAHAVFWNSVKLFDLPFEQLLNVSKTFYCREKEVSSQEEQKTLALERNKSFSTVPSGAKLSIIVLHQIMVPYTEFYSDLVAALVYDDPSVMYVPDNAYLEPGVEANNRDFSRIPIDKGQRLTQHEYFMEARHELWKLTMQEKLSDKQKAEILGKVFAVFRSEIERRWQNGEFPGDRILLNQEMINSFQKVFSNHN